MERMVLGILPPAGSLFATYTGPPAGSADRALSALLQAHLDGKPAMIESRDASALLAKLEGSAAEGGRRRG